MTDKRIVSLSATFETELTDEEIIDGIDKAFIEALGHEEFSFHFREVEEQELWEAERELLGLIQKHVKEKKPDLKIIKGKKE